MPKAGNGLTRAIGRFFLRCLGWRVRGVIPRDDKIMIIAAPHTSNWDFVVAFSVVLALGLRVRIMMKKEAFIWPLKHLFLWAGFVPVDRKQARNVVEQMADCYAQLPKCWMVVTPEGTRAKVEKWKSGFLRIAHAADVKVLLVGLDFPTKTLKIVPELFVPSGNHEQDLQQIQRFYADNFEGKYPHLQ